MNMSDLNELSVKFEEALLSLNRLAAKEVFKKAIADWSPVQITDKLIVPALERIGEGWENGSIALSQVYMSGRISEELVDSIFPQEPLERKEQPKIAIAVLQDHHLLGKRIVYSALRSSGFDLLDYGAGVSAEELADKVKNDDVKILLISVLMLPSAIRIKDVRKKLDRYATGTKIAVGGAPFRFDDLLWKEVGADAMGRSASEAIDIVNDLIGEEQ
jgi:methanogenic corrinoid protein MtbC1